MTVAKRIKWFVPAQDGRQYRPFGIDCEGAATLFGHHGGWNRTGAAGPNQPSPQELAAANRAFWAGLDRVPADRQIRLSSQSDEEPTP
ncbi:hypothetical protein [Micromonospora chokoriensis]|uniref:hypothetical protein n=1 Tax=Micromonospora chokoriensis TaxID=356851 RepID=UPI0004C2C185|nr:hypothetical protein [Micromonospora chokoriensis]